MPEGDKKSGELRVVVDRGHSISMWTAMGAALVGTLLGGLAVWMGLQQRGDQLADGLENGLQQSAAVESAEPKPTPPVRPVSAANSDVSESSAPISLADAVEQTQPSVVCVLWGPTGSKDYVAGAGVIYNSRGIVLTNYHVIEPIMKANRGPRSLRGSRLRARFADGREREAKVLLGSQDEDLAVLELLPPQGKSGADETYAAVDFGQSKELRVGETVFAVGCPVGLDHTVSAGIVSALDRTGVLPNPHVATIQLDAAINLGNSGGPLFDTSGSLVGITSARSARGEGIGFAIPADRVRVYLQALEKGQANRTGVIGAVINAAPPAAEGLLGTSYTTGLTVEEVDPKGPAAAAGLAPGDIIVEIRGKQHAGAGDTRRERANFLREFMDVARNLLPRETLALTVVRNGAKKSIEIVVEAASEAEQARIDIESVFGLRLHEGDQPVIHGFLPGSKLLRMPQAKLDLVDHTIKKVGSYEVANNRELGRVAAAWKSIAQDGRGRHVYMRLESPKGEAVELAYPLDWRDKRN